MQRKERESNPQGSRSAAFEAAAIASWLALPELEESAQRESNPHVRRGKAAGHRYIMGTS
jgi:hypothetical protein